MITETTTIAERIKTLRKEKHYTQLELARMLNVTDKAVSKWESDDGKPDITLLAKLSDIFGVTIDYILTGKIPEEKLVLMSRAELCAKNDDIQLLDELLRSPLLKDDKGFTLFDYIIKYSSKNVFKKLSDTNKLSLVISKDIMNRLMDNSGIIKTSHTNHRVKSSTRQSPNISELIALYILSDSLANLPQIGLNPISSSNFYEWDDTLIDLVLRHDIPKNSHDIIFRMHESKHGNWPAIYSLLMEAAVLRQNNDAVEFLFDLINAINAKALEEMKELEVKGKSFVLMTNREVEDLNKVDHHNLGYAVPEGTFLKKLAPVNNPLDYLKRSDQSPEKTLYVVSFSRKTLEELKNQDLKKLSRFNNINKNVGGFYYDEKTITIEHMKTDKSFSEDDIFLHSCLDNNILNIKKLITSPNLKLIQKALDTYPIHYYEILKKLIENKDYKKIFRYAVDTGFNDLATALLRGQVDDLSKIIYTIVDKTNGDQNRHISSQKNTISPDIIRLQSENMEYCLTIIDKASVKSVIQPTTHIYAYGKTPSLTTKYKYANADELEQLLQKCRVALIKDLSWKADNLKIISELNEPYFMTRLQKGETEFVIIKLSALLEAKLKENYRLSGELIDMLNQYNRLKFDNDEYRSNFKNNSYPPNLLHRLRMMRNNIVHSETNDVAPLTQVELVDCIHYIIEM